MKRSPIRRNPRPEGERVTQQMHAEVRLRDRECVAAKAVRAGVIESHQCRDMWGMPHASQAIALLSVDHVHDVAMMGKRAPSDLRHLAALCYGMNVGGVPAEVRRFEREYLASLPEPEDPHAAHVDRCPGCPAVMA